MALNAVNMANIQGYAPDKIAVDPDFNPRDMTAPDTLAHIAEIAASIRVRGFDPDRPLLGRLSGGSFVVTDGHCRFAAIQMLLAEDHPIKVIPCRAEIAHTSKEERQLLTLRQPGKPLTALEAAVAIKRLMTWGWKPGEIAAKLGRSASWVTDCLELSGADAEVRDVVRNGHIAPTEAVKVIRQHGQDAGEVITRATEHARARGKDKATGQDIRAVTEPLDKPRTAPPTIATIAAAFLAAFEAWPGSKAAPDDVAFAAEELAASLGPLKRAA